MADTPTPNYAFILQQPGTNPKTWGGKLNSNWSNIDTFLKAASDVANSASVLATGALPAAGGTMTGPLVMAAPMVLQDAGPNSIYAAGFRGEPLVTINSDRTFVLSDSGKMVRLFGGVSRTWTIPALATVPFPVGTKIYIRNYGLGGTNLSLVRSAGVALRIAGSPFDQDVTISAMGSVKLTLEDPDIWLVEGVGVS